MDQFLSAKFLSGRNANVKAGIVGVSTNDKVIEAVGRVGIGSTIFDPITDLDVRGSANIRDTLTLNGLNVGAGSSLGITSATQLYVSGITTLAANGGITTTGGDLYVGGDLYINDDLVFDEFTARNGNITGIATIATLRSTTANITTGNIVTGVVTTLSGTNLNYTGVGTIGRIVSTATSFSQLQVTGISTFTNGPVFVGSGTTTGTASQRLQVTGGAYVSGSVGVGTTNPRETLDVIGTVGVQASGSANRFEIQHNPTLNSLDFIFV